MFLIRLFVLCGVLSFPFYCLAQLPTDFTDQKVANFNFPVGITFDGTGQGYVWEKEGKVYVLDSLDQKLPEPLIDISEEVSNWKDHGLMGFTLDANFLDNGYFYLFYALDLHHYYHYGTLQYHPDSTAEWEATIGRVTRYQADPTSGFTTTVPESRKILLGETLSNGVPLTFQFHGIGSLVTGNDGTLLLSVGDATSSKGADTGIDSLGTYYSDALAKGIMTPDEKIGSYRSQYIDSYNGKVLRIDPQTGDGLPSNPFYDPADPRSKASRVWSTGLRNPYRIAVRPGTGSHYPADGAPGDLFIGDVGTGAWEELNIATEGGQNFGWPIMEGHYWVGGFGGIEAPQNPKAPNPLYGETKGCDREFFTFRELMIWPRKPGTYTPPSNPCNFSARIPDSEHLSIGVPPVIAWSNSRWNLPLKTEVTGYDENNIVTGLNIQDGASSVDSETFGGYSALAGIFYTHTQFPEKYHDKYFGFDHEGWIRVFDFDADNQLNSIEIFHEQATNIIHLALNPSNGNLYLTNMQNEVRKISYGGNAPPVAIIKADQAYGPAQLTVQFDGTDSYDAKETIVEYFWDFGDGESSKLPQPQHTFTANGSAPSSFTVQLIVTDSLGATASAEKIISLNNTPPVIEITSFEDGDLYPLDKTVLLQLTATVSDAEHENDELSYQWQAFLHHNDHFHPEPIDFDPVSYTLISPLGCNQDEYWYRVALTVTDPEGLSSYEERNIYPDCQAPDLVEVSLHAKSEDDHILLDWTDVENVDVLKYEIQKSEDFFHFQTIGTVEAQALESYSFQDFQPWKGSNLYRVKVIDKTRGFTYSNLVTADFPPLRGIEVYPNPAVHSIQLKVEQAMANPLRLQVFTPDAIQVMDLEFETVPGQPFDQIIPTASLKNGAYYYRVINGESEKSGVLVIMR